MGESLVGLKEQVVGGNYNLTQPGASIVGETRRAW